MTELMIPIPGSKESRRVAGFVFDMDGTLVLGDRNNQGLKALPGAKRMLQFLRKRDIPFVVFTNGTPRPPIAYAQKLRDAGFKLEDEQMLTPSSSAAELFASKGYKRVMVLGGEGLSKPLEDVGIEAVPAELGQRDVDAVYIGWFREFGLKHHEAACEAVWSGATAYSASQVLFFATANGRQLGSSRAISDMLRGATGCKVNVVGKPSIHAVRHAANRLGIKASTMAVVGDDPELEVLMGHKAKGLAVSVQTGLAGPDAFDDWKAHLHPHLNLRSVKDLLAICEQLV